MEIERSSIDSLFVLYRKKEVLLQFATELCPYVFIPVLVRDKSTQFSQYVEKSTHTGRT